jgi:hypothetical protein
MIASFVFWAIAGFGISILFAAALAAINEAIQPEKIDGQTDFD